MDQFQNLPILQLNQESLEVLDRIITGYIAVVKARSLWDTVQQLESLRMKLAPVLEEGFPEGTSLLLSNHELQWMEEAIRGFAAAVRQIAEPSIQREMTLREVDRLYQYITAFTTKMG